MSLKMRDQITPSLQLLCVSVTISQRASTPATVISSIVFDYNIVFAAITATFLAVVDQSNSCTLIAVWFNCSCHL